jgi:hypothetical protein
VKTYKLNSLDKILWVSFFLNFLCLDIMLGEEISLAQEMFLLDLVLIVNPYKELWDILHSS